MATSHRGDMGRKAFIGGVAGQTLAIVLCTPFDVLRTRLQASTSDGSMVKTVRSLWKAPLRHGFYRGTGVLVVSSVPARGLYMSTYATARASLDNHVPGLPSSAAIMTACLAASAAVSVVFNPLFVVRTRIQTAPVSLATPSVATIVRSILKHEGMMTLWKGAVVTTLGRVVENSIYWVLYEHLKRTTSGDIIVSLRPSLWLVSTLQPSSPQSAAVSHIGASSAHIAYSATVAKFLATVVVYPYQVVSTRLREGPMTASAQGAHSRSQTAMATVRQSLSASPWRLWSGLSPHLIRTIPQNVVVFVVYELAMKYL